MPGPADGSGFADRDGGDVVRFLADPAGEAFMRVRTQLMPAAACDIDAPGLVARFELAVPAPAGAPATRDPVRLDKLAAFGDTIWPITPRDALR